jgi:hypothetical protein
MMGWVWQPSGRGRLYTPWQQTCLARARPQCGPGSAPAAARTRVAREVVAHGAGRQLLHHRQQRVGQRAADDVALGLRAWVGPGGGGGVGALAPGLQRARLPRRRLPSASAPPPPAPP